MGHVPPSFNDVTIFSSPIVADFCAHLFSKGGVAVVGTFAAQREIFPYCCCVVACCLFAAL